MAQKVADLFIQCLENEGVRYVFGVPGEENEELMFSLENSGIRFIPTRHEQGAAFMANVWGRLTGEAGVCLSTLGPGATNLMTGVADAFLDKSPVVAITGQSGLDRINRESHQYLDVVNMFRPITKWNTSIASPATVPDVVRKAFKVAEAEKPGATHIELSNDVAAMECSGKPLPVIRVRRPSPDPVAVQEAAALLEKAERPLILAGNGAVRKRASRDLREFVENYHIPVVHTFMGQGAVSDFSPQSLYKIGLPFRDIVMDALEGSDLILTVGYDIAEYAPENWNPEGDKNIIHIDFTSAEVYARYQPKVEMVADIAASLQALKAQLAGHKVRFDSKWYQPIREMILADIRNYDLSPGHHFTIPGCLNILQEVVNQDALIISDVGTHKLWIARNFSVCCPNGVLISNGLASMGIALPGAIAAALQNPERPIIAMMGDGGFLMNSQELETAKRLGVSFTIIIFNDNDYGQISWKQRLHHDHSTGTKLTNPNFKAYAESFGITGYRPETVAGFRQSLEKAVKSKEISLIEVPVNQSALYDLAKKLKPEELIRSTLK